MSMHPQDLMGLIEQHADSISEGLGDEGFGVLMSRIGELASVPQEARAVRRAVQGVRLALLPLPLDHPVRQALEGSRLTSTVTGTEIGVRAHLLLLRLTAADPSAPDGDQGEIDADADADVEADGPTEVPGDQDAAVAAVIAGARRRILTAPALAPSQLTGRYADPPPRELIGLEDAAGRRCYPAFQFSGGPGGSGGPLPVVLRINRLLLADIDPWGAADWWLSGNRALGGTPASLLGELSDETLAGAARALVEAD